MRGRGKENLILAASITAGSILSGCGPIQEGKVSLAETVQDYDSRGPLKGIIPEEGVLPPNQGLYGPIEPVGNQTVGEFPSGGELTNFEEGGRLDLLEEGGILYPSGEAEEGSLLEGIFTLFGEGGVVRLKSSERLYSVEEARTLLWSWKKEENQPPIELWRIGEHRDFLLRQGERQANVEASLAWNEEPYPGRYDVHFYFFDENGRPDLWCCVGFYKDAVEGDLPLQPSAIINSSWASFCTEIVY